jgi:hypothetical protein
MYKQSEVVPEGGRPGLNLHHGIVMSKYIICQSFKKFWGYSWCQMVILVSEDSNRYAHLFLIEREYFGFNTLESVVE